MYNEYVALWTLFWITSGIDGEHSESKGGVYDLSNKRRLGLTEFAAVREMLDGVLKIKKWEEELAAAKKWTRLLITLTLDDMCDPTTKSFNILFPICYTVSMQNGLNFTLEPKFVTRC